MAHFAEIAADGTVLRVIVADAQFIASGAVGDSASWIECDKRTKGGVRDGGGEALRKNYPGVGWIYDKARDAFVAPKPFDSWVRDDQKMLYEPPKPMPLDRATKYYEWDERTQDWISPEAVKR